MYKNFIKTVSELIPFSQRLLTTFAIIKPIDIIITQEELNKVEEALKIIKEVDKRVKI